MKQENNNFVIRFASPSDASHLSELAFKSKSHWDYPAKWMELWKDDLTITEDYIRMHSVWVLESSETGIIGFAAIEEHPDHLDLSHLWIDPEYIGKNWGKRLYEGIMDKIETSEKQIRVISDPNSVGFYKKQGFVIYQWVPTVPKPRRLPLLVKHPTP